MLTEDQQWQVINSHFRHVGHATHQIQGMEHFLKELLPHIVQENETIELKVQNQIHRIHVLGVKVLPPNFKETKEGVVHPIDAHEARIRGLTMTTPVFTNLEHEVLSYKKPLEEAKESTDTELEKNELEKNELEKNELVSHTKRKYMDVPLCRIPAMVGVQYHPHDEPSKNECPYDEGGYFIVNGNEKVLIPQLKLRVNIPFVWPGKSPGKFLYNAEVRSLHATRYRSTSTMNIKLTDHKQGQLPVLIGFVPFVSKSYSSASSYSQLEIPLFYLYRILGIYDVEEVVRLVNQPEPDSEIEAIVRHTLSLADDKNREQILDWVGINGTKEKTKEKQRKYVMHIFVNEFMPHLGMNEEPETMKQKAWFLSYMVRKLVRVYLKKQPVDDRDSYKNKRLDTAAPLLAVLFRQLYRLFVKSFKLSVTKAIESGKTYISILDYINSSKITSALRYHFGTGNWSLQKNKQTGVVQQLARMTRATTNSHLRRLGTPMINKEGKSTVPRMIHKDDYGINCLVETPEGSPVGLVKNLALLTHIAIGSPGHLLEEYIRELFTFDSMDEAGSVVFVNAIMVGKIQDPHAFVETMLTLRRCEDIPFDTSIVLDPHDNNVLIYTDAGRCLRPLFVLKNMHKFAALYDQCSLQELWPQLRCNGCIEFVDKMEEAGYCVAMRPNEVESHHTHLEIHPCAMFGLVGNDEVFPERNQAPRNMYQASMGKQAIGIPTLNYQQRMDLSQLTLDYPQKPLVTTRFQGIRKQGALPSGQELIVAIMAYGGFNQEDAVLINQSALDRGLLRITKYTTYTDEILDRGTEEETFILPPETAKNRHKSSAYAKLEPGHFTPAIGTKVDEGDVIIAKTMSIVEVDENGNQMEVKRCKSKVVDKGNGGYVDNVMVTTNADGNMKVLVKLRKSKIPIIGDKNSSRHGQKGTIGMTYRQEDLPFTANGMVPDMIVNPNAIPSRMTIGQLMECLLSKVCALKGCYGDGTAFRRVSAEEIADELQAQGYGKWGYERMICGMTGVMLDVPIFMGPTHYQRLKHRVEDKVASRAKGKRIILTRQPIEGRSNGGGLRFGEMERDTLLSHGVVNFLKDRLFYNSDPYSVPVCRRCGLIGIPESSKKFGETVYSKPRCANASCHGKCERVEMPYSMKLLMQELMGMHLALRLRLKKKEDVV